MTDISLGRAGSIVGPLDLSQCVALKMLSLSFLDGITLPAALPQLRRVALECVGLQSLDVARSPMLESLVVLRCADLERVDASGCDALRKVSVVDCDEVRCVELPRNATALTEVALPEGLEPPLACRGPDRPQPLP